MGRSRSGYEYSYSFWRDDDIIPVYATSITWARARAPQRYLFEIRANFKLKIRADDGDDDEKEKTKMMGSERFAAVVSDNKPWVRGFSIRHRLRDYRLSEDEIQSMARDAFDFAARQPIKDDDAIIAVVLGLDLWTVQQEGEPIDAAVDRAVKPEILFPLGLCYVALSEGARLKAYGTRAVVQRLCFLMSLARIRLEEHEDVGGLRLMSGCRVCSRKFTIGDQISFLPDCLHAFHSLCVYNWFRKEKNRCPSCKIKIPTDPETYFANGGFHLPLEMY